MRSSLLPHGWLLLLLTASNRGPHDAVPWEAHTILDYGMPHFCQSAAVESADKVLGGRKARGDSMNLYDFMELYSINLAKFVEFDILWA